MSCPGACFSLRTSAARSPFSSVVLLHDALSRVLENTALDMAFIRSATTGCIWAARGVVQKPAIILFRSRSGDNVNEEPVYNIDVAQPDDAAVGRRALALRARSCHAAVWGSARKSLAT